MSAPFSSRHLGLSDEDQERILSQLGCDSLSSFLSEVIPAEIRMKDELALPSALSEHEALASLRERFCGSEARKSLIGQGYYGTHTPPVIQRNLFENPGWYTAYTPYQAEIAQGRLEALMNFQTMVTELTGLEVANASLLDEGTAVAEAISIALSQVRGKASVWMDQDCHPQTIKVVKTRLAPLQVECVVGAVDDFEPSEDFCAAVVQYPSSLGEVRDFTDFAEQVHQAKGLLIVATDLLALTLLKEPGAMGADLCVGSSQRFGVPMGFGGPHAAFIAVKDALKRRLPGRLVGLSVDSQGEPAYRLSLQTREQHIRRDKATSNICTAQVLLAVMASMYAVWHGPQGLKSMAQRIFSLTDRFASALRKGGYQILNETYFDTLTIVAKEGVKEKAVSQGYDLRQVEAGVLALSFDETCDEKTLSDLCEIFGVTEPAHRETSVSLPRQSSFLTQEVFHRFQTETEMMRYLHRLEKRDLALNHSMIPLGSCTMKLNAAVEMMPLSWSAISSVHPFAPSDTTTAYREVLDELSAWLAEITGFAAVSLQPNAGSQGEYAGLLAIHRYHESRGESQREVCLIPTSSHGTNPASAVMAGFKVVPVTCTKQGKIDQSDLKEKIALHRDALAALMVTYPSTHGDFEEGIQEVCAAVHDAGGQVYLDGANMNAQVGLTHPALIGADVCHLNLHKTFCIPHGGGGPGVGPVCVAQHLVEHLPQHVSAAPYGSASINMISWMYLRMMGPEGLKKATSHAILSANYIAHRLDAAFPVLYRGAQGRVAHECIIDIRPATERSGVTVEDVAKRLIDYGFHAPTMSWPVAGTLMIEPTESESLEEMDRFCEAMLAIHEEIEEITAGKVDRDHHLLKNAPHTAAMLAGDSWDYPYTRERAVFPMPHLRKDKFWPSVARVDNVHGDRHLVCTCDTVEEYART